MGGRVGKNVNRHAAAILCAAVLHLSCVTTTPSPCPGEAGAGDDAVTPPRLVKPQSQKESRMGSRAEKIQITFNALNKDNVPVLDGFYHPEVVFEDPLVRINGLERLKRYYADMYESVTAISFDFSEQIVEEDTHVAIWSMRMRFRKLNKGREVQLDGISVIRFNEEDLVVYHRDYFDVGAMVYEQVPFVGYLVRQVKKRLQKH
jgi:hypothetical protein